MPEKGTIKQQQQQSDEQQEELTQVDRYMEIEEIPPLRSSSLKRRWDEEGLKYTKRERKYGQSRVEKALEDLICSFFTCKKGTTTDSR